MKTIYWVYRKTLFIKLYNLFKEGEFKDKGRYYFQLYDGHYILIKNNYLEKFIPVMINTLEIPEEVCKIHLPVEESHGLSWFEL
jgi:hypothetical protein